MCIEHATVLQAGLMMDVSDIKQVIQFNIKVSCLAPFFEGKGCWVQAS